MFVDDADFGIADARHHGCRGQIDNGQQNLSKGFALSPNYSVDDTRPLFVQDIPVDIPVALLASVSDGGHHIFRSARRGHVAPGGTLPCRVLAAAVVSAENSVISQETPLSVELAYV